jgi:uncharacterized protein (DUF2267 family)
LKSGDSKKEDAMKHDEFVGQVQHRAQLASRGDAETIIRATLETLGERLQPSAAAHVAAQLPPELGRHLLNSMHFEHLTLLEFYERVAEREHKAVDRAIGDVDAVVATLREAISPGAVRKLRHQMPRDFRGLLASYPPA